MTEMRINLMPRPPRPETLKRLRIAQVGALKSLVYHLRKENEAQGKLLEAYKRYFDFMERRYPVGKGLRREIDDINGAGSSEREAGQGQTKEAGV